MKSTSGWDGNMTWAVLAEPLVWQVNGVITGVSASIPFHSMHHRVMVIGSFASGSRATSCSLRPGQVLSVKTTDEGFPPLQIIQI